MFEGENKFSFGYAGAGFGLGLTTGIIGPGLGLLVLLSTRNKKTSSFAVGSLAGFGTALITKQVTGKYPSEMIIGFVKGRIGAKTAGLNGGTPRDLPTAYK